MKALKLAMWVALMGMALQPPPIALAQVRSKPVIHYDLYRILRGREVSGTLIKICRSMEFSSKKKFCNKIEKKYWNLPVIVKRDGLKVTVSSKSGGTKKVIRFYNLKKGGGVRIAGVHFTPKQMNDVDYVFREIRRNLGGKTSAFQQFFNLVFPQAHASFDWSFVLGMGLLAGGIGVAAWFLADSIFGLTDTNHEVNVSGTVKGDVEVEVGDETLEAAENLGDAIVEGGEAVGDGIENAATQISDIDGDGLVEVDDLITLTGADVQKVADDTADTIAGAIEGAVPRSAVTPRGAGAPPGGRKISPQQEGVR